MEEAGDVCGGNTMVDAASLAVHGTSHLRALFKQCWFPVCVGFCVANLKYLSTFWTSSTGMGCI
jgi:hypothetical protein